MKRMENYTSPTLEVMAFAQDVIMASALDNFGEFIWTEEEEAKLYV